MPANINLPSLDEILRQAAQFLIDGQKFETASVLLFCDLKKIIPFKLANEEDFQRIRIHLAVPEPYYSRLIAGQEQTELSLGWEGADAYSSCDYMVNEIGFAFESVLLTYNFKFAPYYHHISWTVERRALHLVPLVTDPGTNWRIQLGQAIEGKAVHNQAVEAATAVVWHNLRFRSASEMRMAQALDRAGVMFLPNCKAAVGEVDQRENRGPDFLICHKGKWGILEVDGEPYHPPSRTVQDHERDRLFRQHGVKVVEHFDSKECFENPDGVAQKFLHILEQNG